MGISIPKNPDPPKGPKKTSQIHLAQGLEAEIETKEPEKDYNSWQHKAGDFLCYRVVLIFAFGFPAYTVGFLL